jgi:hypothetical protein
MERKERIKMEWNRIKEWVGVFSFQCVWEFIKGCKKKKKKKGDSTSFNKGNQAFQPTFIWKA